MSAEAARQRLVTRGLIADWEAAHGAFTEEELARARSELGRRPSWRSMQWLRR